MQAGRGGLLGVLIALAVWLPGCNSASFDDGLYGGQARPASSSAASGSGEGQALAIANRYMDESSPGASGYKIGPLDVLDIRVFKVEDLSRSVQVAESGSFNFPLVGEVRAVGRTPSQLEHDLMAKLNASYLKGAQVTVFVKEYNSNRVTLDGAVKSPGVYSVKGGDTVMTALALGGGLDRSRASSNVLLFRKNPDGTRVIARYDISAIQSGSTQDPAVQAGDVIVVEDSVLKSTFEMVKGLGPAIAGPLMYTLI